MKKLLLPLIGMVFVGTVCAAPIPGPQSANIPIPVPGNGVVSPGQTLQVSLDPLNKFPNVPYNVSCKIATILSPITELNPDTMYFSTSGFGDGPGPVFKINGNQVPSTGNYQLNLSPNSYVAYQVASQGAENPEALTFTNLDNTDTVTVQNCSATPSL